MRRVSMVMPNNKGLNAEVAYRASARRRNEKGQTLIIAILVLGVLLVIGFAFAGLVSRNIADAGRSQDRKSVV